MKYIVILIFFYPFFCKSQSDTIVYYNTCDKHLKIKNVEKSIKITSKKNFFEIWEYSKYNDEWHDPSSHKNAIWKNDSTLIIKKIKNNTKKTQSVNTRIVKVRDDNTYNIREYNDSGNIVLEGISTLILPLNLTGIKIKYYDNGQKSEEELFVNNEIVGNKRWKENGEKDIDNVFFYCVDKMPEFKGGLQNLMRFLKENLSYPRNARDARIMGSVYINFIIMEDGTISGIKLIKGIDADCDKEAIRVVSIMPKWNPGIHKGKPVRVSFNLPIRFVIR